MEKNVNAGRSRVEVGVLEMAAAMAIAGSIGVFALESQQPPFTVVFYRCLFGALSLGAYCLYRGVFRQVPYSVRNLALICIGGAFLVYNWVLMFEALRLTSISIVTIVYHVNPFIILLLGIVFFAERIDRHKLGWTLFAFLGLISVIGIPDAFEGDYIQGIVFTLLATTLYSFTIVFSKWVTGVPPAFIAFVQVSVGVLLVLPFVDFAQVPVGRQWFFLISLGVLHTGVEYVLLYSAFQKLSMALIAILSFVYPVVAIGLDYAVYGHLLSFQQIIGVVMIALATLGVRLGWKLTLPGRKAA
ncbi:DMT family transporter [Pelagibius sp. Alg239-R121]|uniref:DMT family transporter n=1 Tax=Pelagibius sp. Alg239-R121 TaxID=2993448 RepID=UPI0024A6BCAC|nr:DMT family transporter [Pelagibius sp. Alg239-R121]